MALKLMFCLFATKATCHLFEAVGFETVREMKLVHFFIDGVPAFPFASNDNITRLCLKKISKDMDTI